MYESDRGSDSYTVDHPRGGAVVRRVAASASYAIQSRSNFVLAGSSPYSGSPELRVIVDAARLHAGGTTVAQPPIEVSHES